MATTNDKNPEQAALDAVAVELRDARTAEAAAYEVFATTDAAFNRAKEAVERAEAHFEEARSDAAWTKVTKAREALDRASLVRDKDARKASQCRAAREEAEKFAAEAEARSRLWKKRQAIVRALPRLTKKAFDDLTLPIVNQLAIINELHNVLIAELDRVVADYDNRLQLTRQRAREIGWDGPTGEAMSPWFGPRFMVGRVFYERNYIWHRDGGMPHPDPIQNVNDDGPDGPHVQVVRDLVARMKSARESENPIATLLSMLAGNDAEGVEAAE